jgi:hypothetical protein
VSPLKVIVLIKSGGLTSETWAKLNHGNMNKKNPFNIVWIIVKPIWKGKDKQNLCPIISVLNVS